jgi:hypothetical protein
MPRSIDDELAALAGHAPAAALDGLEDQVWAKLQARKAAAGAGSVGVRAALTLAALAIGLAFGALHPQTAPAHLSEMGVLSEDGLLAPSIRLGGGA